MTAAFLFDFVTYYQPSSQQLSLFWNHTTPLRRLWDTEMGEREKFFCFSYVRKKSERKLSSYSFFFFYFPPAFTIFLETGKLIWLSHTVRPCVGTCLSPVMTETEIGRLAPLGWSLLLEIPYCESLITSAYLNQITMYWNRWLTIDSTYASSYICTSKTSILLFAADYTF